MVLRKSKSVKNTGKWKRNKASYKRRSGRAGRHVGTGRWVVVAFICLAVLYYFILPTVHKIASHPIFTVSCVTVSGAEYIGKEEILKVAGIELGWNIFDFDVAEVSARLEEGFSAEDFTVYKQLPNTIAVKVLEKQPVALLNMKELVGVDKHGDPLPHIGADMVASLPIITGISTTKALSDSVTRKRLAAGLELLEKIKNEAPSTYKRISEIDVTNIQTLGVSLIDNGLEVVIGEKDWARKIPVLDKVINQVTYKRENVKAVDIRFGEVVVVRK